MGKTMKFVQETELIMQNMIGFLSPSNVHITQESCHFENLASISSYQPELDQNQIFDILISYPFPETELEDEFEPELQFSDPIESISTPVVLPKLSNILELVLIPIISKLDQHQILDSYPIPEIELEDECEHELQFSDLSPILKSNIDSCSVT